MGFRATQAFEDILLSPLILQLGKLKLRGRSVTSPRSHSTFKAVATLTRVLLIVPHSLASGLCLEGLLVALNF